MLQPSDWQYILPRNFFLNNMELNLTSGAPMY